MRLQSIHRQALVIFSIISFLWCIQKASEALAFVEEDVEDMHVKSYLEKPQGHIDEVFLRKRSDVEVEEQESNLEEMKDSEDGIDQKDKEKLVKDRVEFQDQNGDGINVEIEDKIDGPSSSNNSKGGSNGAFKNNKSRNDLIMLEIAESDIDQNQETGRKKVDGSAKNNFEDASETLLDPKMRPNQRADKKLQVMQADLSHDMEAGRKKITQQNNSINQN